MQNDKVSRRSLLKKSILGGLAIGTAGITVASGQSTDNASAVPPRQGKSVMGFRCDPIPTVRIGIVGLRRGGEAATRLARIEGTHIVAIGDIRADRVASTQERLKNAGRPEAFAYSGEEDWKKMCERDDIDLIYNATPWGLHVPIALYAMQCGKHAAVEVPAALTVKDCWALVDTAESTQRHL